MWFLCCGGGTVIYEVIQMTTYKGKGVYSAVAVGKISVFKRQDVQVKRIKDGDSVHF